MVAELQNTKRDLLVEMEVVSRRVLLRTNTPEMPCMNQRTPQLLQRRRKVEKSALSMPLGPRGALYTEE